MHKSRAWPYGACGSATLSYHSLRVPAYTPILLLHLSFFPEAQRRYRGGEKMDMGDAVTCACLNIYIYIYALRGRMSLGNEERGKRSNRVRGKGVEDRKNVSSSPSPVPFPIYFALRVRACMCVCVCSCAVRGVLKTGLRALCERLPILDCLLMLLIASLRP